MYLKHIISVCHSVILRNDCCFPADLLCAFGTGVEPQHGDDSLLSLAHFPAVKVCTHMKILQLGCHQ